MSLSNPTLTNPAEHFFRWAGSIGKLQWYDKENQKNVEVRLPFTFIVLDQLATITGYSKRDEAGFWSNEVRSSKKDTLYVRTKKGPYEAGLYENLTQTLKSGGKYATSIYIAHKDGSGNWVIGNIQASGSALSSWIEFNKAHNVSKGQVSMSKGPKQTAPTGDFYAPEFKMEAWTDEDYKVAVELDKQLQVYLGQYLAQPKGDEEELAGGTMLATPEENNDFERRREASSLSNKPEPSKQVDDVVIEYIDDEPINLDDIPF